MYAWLKEYRDWMGDVLGWTFCQEDFFFWLWWRGAKLFLALLQHHITSLDTERSRKIIRRPKLFHLTFILSFFFFLIVKAICLSLHLWLLGHNKTSSSCPSSAKAKSIHPERKMERQWDRLGQVCFNRQTDSWTNCQTSPSPQFTCSLSIEARVLVRVPLFSCPTSG